MNYCILFLAFVLLQDIPFKPNEEFEVNLDYQFKPRPHAEQNMVQLDQSGQTVYVSGQTSSTAVLPYLILNITLHRLPEEKMRMRISNNLNERGSYKKVNTMDVVKLDLGFTDDIRVHAPTYTLTFLNSDRVPVDRILINVDEDGSFFVNGEKRGRF